MSYNVLAKSLGSNCIPWVMHCSDASLVAEVEAHTGQSWGDWKAAVLKGDYMRHFHKNRDSHDYDTMRSLFSAGKLESQEDVPSTLTGITFVSENTVKYTAGDEERVRTPLFTVASGCRAAARRVCRVRTLAFTSARWAHLRRRSR